MLLQPQRDASRSGICEDTSAQVKRRKYQDSTFHSRGGVVVTGTITSTVTNTCTITVANILTVTFMQSLLPMPSPLLILFPLPIPLPLHFFNPSADG